MTRELKVRNPEVKREFLKLWDSVDGLQDMVGAGAPVMEAKASGTLTFDGAVVHGEFVTVGADKYQFAADEALTVDEGAIAADITAVTVASQGTLTLAVNPVSADEDTITIGDITYAFVEAATEDTDIEIGSDAEATQVNTVAVINATHPDVVIGDFAIDVAIITAKIGGTVGNLIATVSNFESGSNLFDGVTLGTETAGVDCTDVNAALAIIAAFDEATEPVVAATGGSKIVTVTAKNYGDEANAIVTTSNADNGTWAATKLAGGKYATAAEAGTILVDATNLYISYAESKPTAGKWKKITLESL